MEELSSLEVAVVEVAVPGIEVATKEPALVDLAQEEIKDLVVAGAVEVLEMMAEAVAAEVVEPLVVLAVPTDPIIVLAAAAVVVVVLDIIPVLLL